MTNDEMEYDPVENRSEIAILWDAELCNPNGDPLADDRPRRDNVTNRGVVTDVRMKRYIRDQLADDGHDIFIRAAETEDGTRMRRDELLLDTFEGVASVDDIDNVNDLFDGTDIGDVFLDTVTDVRYFGVTLSFSADEDDIDDALEDFYETAIETLPRRVEGPVQLTHGRSLHPVHIAEHTEKLAPIVQGKTGKEQGTFADDYRIKYGMYKMHGVVNENAAAEARLGQRDVKRLDNTTWRALTSQTLTRSKLGQTPRLYARVEYAEPSYYDGALRNAFDLDESSKNHAELETVDDLAVAVDGFVDAVSNRAAGIERIRLKTSPMVTFTYHGEEIEETLVRFIRQQLGGEASVPTVEEIDVSEEADALKANTRTTADAYDLS